MNSKKNEKSTTMRTRGAEVQLCQEEGFVKKSNPSLGKSKYRNHIGVERVEERWYKRVARSRSTGEIEHMTSWSQDERCIIFNITSMSCNSLLLSCILAMRFREEDKKMRVALVVLCTLIFFLKVGRL